MADQTVLVNSVITEHIFFRTMKTDPNSRTLASFSFTFKKLENLYFIETNKLSLENKRGESEGDKIKKWIKNIALFIMLMQCSYIIHSS